MVTEVREFGDTNNKNMARRHKKANKLGCSLRFGWLQVQLDGR